jgi:hypothetical protein
MQTFRGGDIHQNEKDGMYTRNKKHQRKKTDDSELCEFSIIGFIT